MSQNLDDIFFKSYLQEYGEKEKKKILTTQEDRIIAARKRNELSTIEKFLNKFVELEVKVQHCDQYTKNLKTSALVEPQDFKFYFVDSSKTWAPGISIWFDHPAQVEIAIPNTSQEGKVVIKVASHHPDAYILEQFFSSHEDACIALGKFLGRCTLSMGKKPDKYLKQDTKKIVEASSTGESQTPCPSSITGVAKAVPQIKKSQEFFKKTTQIEKED